MRLVFLVPLVVALCISAFGIGLYAGVKRTWPVPELKGLVAKLTNQATGKDQFGRLLSFPGAGGERAFAFRAVLAGRVPRLVQVRRRPIASLRAEALR